MPPSEEIFVCKASTSQYLIVFLISAFHLQYFTRYQGGPKFTLGALRTPGCPLVENVYTQNEYFGISNCSLNFNFLALVVSEILGGPKFLLGGAAPLRCPQRKIFYTKNEYFGISNCIFNFNFLAPVVSEMLGGSQVYPRGYAPMTPPSGEIFVR